MTRTGASSEFDKPKAILLNPSALLGEHVLVAIVAVCGKPRVETVGQELRMTIDDPRPRAVVKRIVPVRSWKTFDVSALLDEAERVLADAGISDVYRPDVKRKRDRPPKRKAARQTK